MRTNNKATNFMQFMRLNNRLFMHILSIFFVVLLFVLFPLLNINCFARFWESLKTFGFGFYYYFVNLLSDTTTIPETTYNYLINNLNISIFLPIDSSNLGTYISSAFFISFNKDYFLTTLSSGSDIIKALRIIFTLSILLILIGYISYTLIFSERDPLITGETKGLKKYLNFRTNFINKIINPIKTYIDFLKLHKSYLFIYVLILLLNYNVLSILFEILGYFFLFVSSLNFFTLYELLFVLLYTIIQIIVTVNPFVLFIVVYLVFDLIRKNQAKQKLQGYDNKNVEFVTNLGVATYIYGPPGCGKTKFMTDLVLSTDKFFRNKAYSILENFEALFPDINYVTLRRYMDYYISRAHLDNPNRSTDNRIQLSNIIRNLVKEKEEKNETTLFGFDFKKKKDIWIGNKFVTFDTFLQAYSEAYYIYVVENPLIYSNYPIRFDSYMNDNEYFKTWNNDLFDVDESNFREVSQFSYILDFDEIRLGNKYSGYSGMIDCGIVAITEIDKERGNKFNLEGLQRTSKTPNLKNDLFNPFWKLGRHPSTVDYYPFLRLYGDLQRLDSLNCDLLESGEMLICIDNSSNERTALHLSQYSTAFLETINEFTERVLFKLKTSRNFKSLFSYIIERINSWTYLCLAKRSNLFGYKEMDLKIVTSKKDDSEDFKTKYILINKKIYADRYATDVYRNYFEQMLDKKTFKNNKQREFLKEQYSSIYATKEQFHKQNSFMINDIENCQALKFTGDNDKATKMALKARKLKKGKSITKDAKRPTDAKESKDMTNRTNKKEKKED